MILATGDRSNPDLRIVVAKSKTRISTTLQIPTGPLRLRNQEYMVFDEPMDAVILARPIRQTIVFDLDKHLAYVREEYRATDFAHIGCSPAVFDTAVETPPSNPRRLSQFLLHCTEHNYDNSQFNSQTPAACFYGNSQAEIDDNETREDAVTGIHDDTELQIDLHQLLSEAAPQGLPESLYAQLVSLVLEYSDIFRNKMGSDSPAKVAPIIIRLREFFRPVRVKLRPYSPPLTAFLRKKVDELLELGIIFRNPNSGWASAPLISPKPGLEQFSFTVDLRPVNSQTEPIVWSMPHIDCVLSQLRATTHYACL